MATAPGELMSQSLTADTLTAPLIVPSIPPVSSPTVIIPEPAALRELYDAAITELPNHELLRTKFYSQVGNAVFNAAHSALTDTVNGGPILRRLAPEMMPLLAILEAAQ
jgi:hypothetical protein